MLKVTVSSNLERRVAGKHATIHAIMPVSANVNPIAKQKLLHEIMCRTHTYGNLYDVALRKAVDRGCMSFAQQDTKGLIALA